MSDTKQFFRRLNQQRRIRVTLAAAEKARQAAAALDPLGEDDSDTDVACTSCGHVHPDHLRCREPARDVGCTCGDARARCGLCGEHYAGAYDEHLDAGGCRAAAERAWEINTEETNR